MTHADQVRNRAILLMQQSRYAVAAAELRRGLVEDSNDALLHAMLSVCLSHGDQLDEAEAEAARAVALAPDEAYCHFCRSIVLEQRRRFAEAEAAAREAVRLDPGDAGNYGRLAATLFAQGKWRDTLDAAHKGLERDAEHGVCTHLQTMALTKLNLQHEAIASVDRALARDPDDAMAHANKGWALLHQGQPKPALEHFREALRLDPNFDYARAGMVEALKAKNFLYRWMLAYFLWMSRLSNQARWAVVLIGYFGYQGLRRLGASMPELAPWILPLLILYLAFVVLTWFAVPLFNLLLRLHPYGRHALSRDQRAGANWFAACLAAFVAAVAASFFADSEAPLVAAIVAVGMALPLTTLYMCDPGWPRQAMTWFTIAMGAVGVIAVANAALDGPLGPNLGPLFAIGVIATPWVANALVSATPTR